MRDLSPLDGRALVARKVVRWVAMACSYPDGLEYNAEQDAESTRIALAEWPTPIGSSTRSCAARPRRVRDADLIAEDFEEVEGVCPRM